MSDVSVSGSGAPSPAPAPANSWNPIAAVNFPAGAPIYVNGDGEAAPAKADDATTANVSAIALGPGVAGQRVFVGYAGLVPLSAAQWDSVIEGGGSLTPGATYYASATTAGLITTTPPSGGGDLDVRVGDALSTTVLLIKISNASAGGASIVADQQTIVGASTIGNPLVAPGAALACTTYGTVGDGMADDTAAMQRAVNAAIAQGRQLFIPRPTVAYKITNTIFITTSDGLRIFGNDSAIEYDITIAVLFEISGDSARITIEGLNITDPAQISDKTVRQFVAILLLDGATDCLVTRNTFSWCSAMSSNDSVLSARCDFISNYVHNCIGGCTVPSHSIISGNRFICDTVIAGPHGRAQAIYEYGSFQDIDIVDNVFINIAEEDIQIRASDGPWQQKNNFRVCRNYFENSFEVSIWAGGDASTDVGCMIITDNMFKGVNTALFLNGCRSAVVKGNHAEWDWQSPYVAPTEAAYAITCGVGVGHFGTAAGIVFSGNKAIQRHPFWATITLTVQPSIGDTVTVGNPADGFVYTFRAVAAAPFDVAIGVDVGHTTTNLVAAIQAEDGLTLVPCNVLRAPTDAFSNRFGAPDNVVVVVSFASFALATTGAQIALSGITDGRQSQGVPWSFTLAINPIISGNIADDFLGSGEMTTCYFPTVLDNVCSNDVVGAGVFISHGNVQPYYNAGNRVVRKNLLDSPRPWAIYSIDDAFPIIDAITPANQQLTTPQLLGRSGTTPIGDGRAFTFLYYGVETIGSDADDPATLPYRWSDGTQVILQDPGGVLVYIFTFKRTAPGAGQFNTADSLLALINATGTYTAAYAPFTNDTGSGNPKLTIKITHAAGGVAGNGHQVYVLRYATPTITGGNSYERTPQSMMCGIILRNKIVPDDFATLQGGAATLVRTYVMSPAADSGRPVHVRGIDTASDALAPVVYQADIIPGCGFTITHSVGAGTESFAYALL